jgi:hypothetical protein
MCKHKVKEKMQALEKNCGGWQTAIQDANNRIKELRFSIRVFKEKLSAGEPWPAEEKN